MIMKQLCDFTNENINTFMGKLRNFKRIDLGQIIDSHDGKLSVAESDIDIPFNIKRVYYIYDFDQINRLELSCS